MKLRNKETGEITEATITVCNWTNDYEDLLTEAEYENISDVMRDWEDYKPAEPLIKDNKIRETVRLWAEANSVYTVLVEIPVIHGNGRTVISSRSFGSEIIFNKIVSSLEDNKQYTIAELCGEEE